MSAAVEAPLPIDNVLHSAELISRSRSAEKKKKKAKSRRSSPKTLNQGEEPEKKKRSKSSRRKGADPEKSSSSPPPATTTTTTTDRLDLEKDNVEKKDSEEGLSTTIKINHRSSSRKKKSKDSRSREKKKSRRSRRASEEGMEVPGEEVQGEEGLGVEVAIEESANAATGDVVIVKEKKKSKKSKKSSGSRGKKTKEKSSSSKKQPQPEASQGVEVTIESSMSGEIVKPSIHAGKDKTSFIPDKSETKKPNESDLDMMSGSALSGPTPTASMSRSGSNIEQTTSTTTTATTTTTSSLGPLHSVAGQAPPSAVVQTRRLSKVVKLQAENDHEMAVGRPAIVLPKPLEERKRSVTVNGPPVTRKPSRLNRSSSAQSANTKQYLVVPPPLRMEAWSEPAAMTFDVRGPNYLSDRRKHKSEPSLFRLLTVDLVQSEQPILTGLCSHPMERIQKALSRERARRVKELPDFVFAVNLVIPGQTYQHSVFYFGLDDKHLIQDKETAIGRLASKFFFGPSDDFRNQTFKLIPRIVDGNFMVRKSVGSKPAILGKKLKQQFIRTDRFLEVIVDIGSDKIAEKIVRLSIGYAKTMVVDMAFLLEGADKSTLPEQLLGAVRMSNIDFRSRDGQRVCHVI